MADVIRLEDRQMRAPQKTIAEPRAISDAVILLFTGIRYERLDGYVGPGPAKTPFQGTAKKH